MRAKKAGGAEAATLRIKQLRSGIGFSVDQKATLRALGLGKIGRVRQVPDNPQTRGMVAKVAHLVVIEPEPGQAQGER